MHPHNIITALLMAGQFLAASGASPSVPLTANKGQWPSQVLYRGMMSNSAIFVERNALTYVLWSGMEHEHHAQADKLNSLHSPRMHAYQVHFEGGGSSHSEGKEQLPQYENYFIGIDTTRWAGGCAVYTETSLYEMYPGIELRVSGRNALKYDLIVSEGANPGQIVMRYDGVDDLHIVDGKLYVNTSAGTTIEQEPFAYQQVNGKRVTVPCRYALDGDRVRFDLPNGYDPTVELVIDPVLSFSTYSGSSANNFGSTATYDQLGHLYGAGTVFNVGYPTTIGAFDNSFNGDSIDIAISKFATDGATLLWSTYLGGQASETPHSLVVNSNNELYVMGTTGSADYPTTVGAYDQTFAGGPPVNYSNGFGFTNASGVDLVVTRFNAAGTQLLGSTFIGGSGNDGVNDHPALNYNYGDLFRGEVALDALERPVLATVTQSANAPTTAGAPQSDLRGSQDGYVLRLNAGLTSLLWATYLGGTGDDAAYGIQFGASGALFVAGGTNSSDLPMAGTPLNSTFQGDVDGFVMRYSAAGALIASTYLGTSSYDQCYFVQVDLNNDVYVLGQSAGSYPVTGAVFNQPNSGQFIHKMDNSLSTNIWSTVVGSGNGGVDVSPTAFLVSDCGQIYFSGWGGIILGGSLSTNGLSVTSDAFQSSTDGSDFYLMVLEPDAVALNYATFFGGGSSQEHVDGGTSRFDKDGTVYQAVCAGCGGYDDFPTTAGAWSAVNGSSCNLGVFKFNLTQNLAVIDISGPPYVCLGDPAQFSNQSIGGNDYFWSFGDSNSSTDFEPVHTYAQGGTYTVMMVLYDSAACATNDTTYLTVVVHDPADAAVLPPDPICPGDSVQLVASGGTSYTWSPTLGLSDPNSASPMASPPSNTTYTVVIQDPCFVDTVTVTVTYGQPAGGAGPDVPMCIGGSAQLQGSGGVSYLWSPAATLNDPTLAMPTATPTDTTTYSVMVTTNVGCVFTDSMQVLVQFQPPSTVNNDTAVCPGGTVQLIAYGGDTYTWQTAPGISTLNIAQPLVTPPQSITYVVSIGNACGSVLDSVHVEVIAVHAEAWPDTIICPGDPVTLYALGGVDYSWSPSSTLSVVDSAITVATPLSPTAYKVTVVDVYGCVDSANVFVDHFPEPVINAGPDQVTQFWQPVQLFASGDSGSIHWTPIDYVSCTTCFDPIASPETTMLFTVTLTDSNTCRAIDDVLVIIEGSLFVPNAFTPNGDGINDAFFASAVEVKEFELLVFNRWGELIFSTEDPNGTWDGTYNGVESPIDTYIWKVKMIELAGRRRNEIGHVSLIR